MAAKVKDYETYTGVIRWLENSFSLSFLCTFAAIAMMTQSQKFPYAPVAIDESGVNDRIARITSRSIKNEAKKRGLEMALSMIDLTTLEGADTPGKVKQLCYKAMHSHTALDGLPHVAAVCVYPSMVKTAVITLKGSGVKVASVATAFPSGQAPLKIKLEETQFAVDEGADEVDMVISRGKFLAGEYTYVYDEICAVKEACGNARLKVILETGELGTLDRVRKASDIALHANVDFIKTSTGKISPAATLPVTLIMLEAIRDYFMKTGKMTGMKPAGGISTAKQALHYLWMVKEIMGDDWINPHWFRFGASRLTNDILMQLEKQAQGNYQSSDYFSKD